MKGCIFLEIYNDDGGDNKILMIKDILLSIFSCPFTGRLFVSCTVRLIHLSDLRDQRVVRVGVGQERADGQEHLGHGECGAPLVTQNI